MRAAVLIICCLFCGAYSFSQTTNRIILKFKPGIDYQVDYNEKKLVHPALAGFPMLDHLESVSSMVNKNLPENPHVKSIGLIRDIHFLRLSTAVTDSEIANLLRTGLFEYVERDGAGTGAGVELTTPNDTYFPGYQWSLKNNGTFSGTAVPDADIDMDEAWDITTGDANTIVCVLDAGCKLDHPEFSGRIWTNTAEIPGNGLDDDANGYVDDVQGWDWANNDNNPTDDHGHGTNVCSILAAKGNNASGMAGINWNCKLMVGKILDASNSGFYSWWESGIYYAVANGAKVINMSVGGSGYSASMQDACDFAMANNVMIAVCMHNQNTSTPYYPAAYSSVIAVGSTSDNDWRTVPFPWSATSGSNYGGHIDLVAPGNNILGAYYLNNVNYNYWAGTSQATPEVAGVISLMLALKPNLTFTQTRNILISTAQDQVGNPLEDAPGWDQYYGYGRLNARAALQAVLNLVPLKFGDITARRNGNSNELEWSTFEEAGIANFVVEYSVDRAGWKSVGNVMAQGGAGEHRYQFYHEANRKSDAYYRVKAFSRDGLAGGTKIVRVGKTGTELLEITSVIASPQLIKINISAETPTPVGIRLYAMDGKILFKQNRVIGVGGNTIDIARLFTPGTYQIVLASQQSLITKSVLVR